MIGLWIWSHYYPYGRFPYDLNWIKSNRFKLTTNDIEWITFHWRFHLFLWFLFLFCATVFLFISFTFWIIHWFQFNIENSLQIEWPILCTWFTPDWIQTRQAKTIFVSFIANWATFTKCIHESRKNREKKKTKKNSACSEYMDIRVFSPNFGRMFYSL